MKVKKIVDALDLKRGDKILVSKDRVETVVAPSTRTPPDGVRIHTDRSDTQTLLPCPVKVMGD